MKNQKGITLIALVVTIIVLLILAGITIAMLTGDNGIITRTNDSKMSQIEGQVREEVKLAAQSAKIFAMQQSIETSGGGWFADENDATPTGELTSVVCEMRKDLKHGDNSAAVTTITDSYDVMTKGGYDVDGATGSPSTITIKYSSSDYQAATNNAGAYIQAVINVVDNNFTFASLDAFRDGSTAKDINK